MGYLETELILTIPPDLNADFNIRRVKNDTHSQLGDNFGALSYEPLIYNDPKNAYKGKYADYYRAVIITIGGVR